MAAQPLQARCVKLPVMPSSERICTVGNMRLHGVSGGSPVCHRQQRHRSAGATRRTCRTSRGLRTPARWQRAASTTTRCCGRRAAGRASRGCRTTGTTCRAPPGTPAPASSSPSPPTAPAGARRAARSDAAPSRALILLPDDLATHDRFYRYARKCPRFSTCDSVLRAATPRVNPTDLCWQGVRAQTAPGRQEGPQGGCFGPVRCGPQGPHRGQDAVQAASGDGGRGRC